MSGAGSISRGTGGARAFGAGLAALPLLASLSLPLNPARADVEPEALEALGRGEIATAVNALAARGESAQGGLLCVHFLSLGCDAERAVGLLETAAPNGSADLRYALALALLALDAPRTSEAVGWLEMGVATGHAPAQLLLATLLEASGDPAGLARAAALYEAAAGGGLALAQTRLGALLEAGRGVAADGMAAERWYRMAAEAGHVEAQYALGLMHMRGDLIDGDLFEAVWWLEKAAEAGHARAQDSLGRAYAGGRGVRQDPEEALRWFLLAAEKGLAVAQMNAGVLYERNFYVQNPAAAAHWYERAALQGYGPAMIALGDLHRYGDGVAQNLSLAQGWYSRALESGGEDVARQARERMLSASAAAARIGVAAIGVGDRFPTPGELFDAIVSLGVMENALFPGAGAVDPELEAAIAESDRINRAGQQRWNDITMEGVMMNP